MAIVKTSSKCQIVIPKEIRNRVNIKPNKRVLLEVVKDHIELTPLPDDPIEALCGIFKGASLTDALLKERRKEFQHEEEKVARFVCPPCLSKEGS